MSRYASSDLVSEGRRTGPSQRIEEAWQGLGVSRIGGCLLPEFIGRGYGGYLLNAIVDLAWSAGPCGRLWVHTCDLDHPRALGVYQKAGFQPFRQYSQTLPDPRLAGLPLPERATSNDAATGSAEIVQLNGARG
jgi:GNAT superfamily N-acetyltransferase